MLSQRDGGGVKAQVGKNEGKWYLAHRILGARGLGEVKNGCGKGRKQINNGSWNKDQLGGKGGQKGKPEEQLRIQVSDRGL